MVTKYDNGVFQQTWFSDPNFPNNMPALYDRWWGYLHNENIAPVVLGEFGTLLNDPQDTVWLNSLVTYLGRNTGANGMSWTFWCWNPNSGDTGGILNDDWTTVNQTKHNLLVPMLFPLDGGGTPTNTPLGPTFTPTRTNTPTGPTFTPTRTPTSTNTPTGPAFTPTWTPTQGASSLKLQYRAADTNMTITGNIAIDSEERNFNFDGGSSVFQSSISCRSSSGTNDASSATPTVPTSSGWARIRRRAVPPSQAFLPGSSTPTGA